MAPEGPLHGNDEEEGEPQSPSLSDSDEIDDEMEFEGSGDRQDVATVKSVMVASSRGA